ncbi:hypothetical protein Fmac_025545 [Flemingia macrophylla]|uniref:ATPase AAA-type core domain-containing protein n=1 Tax=Flemingia macrophylla TaxID=520843 RepID=A0ABD1LSI1_9FABA
MSDASVSSSSEEETVSSSEHAIYEEKVEPEFALMKTMLRKSYLPKKAAAEEKNAELEVGNGNKRGVTSNLVNGEGMGWVWNGPRFRDLGGTKEVLEEVKMEVVVPLCHPQLPRQLGISPMSGILLHAPPGSGNTKLAHAIANETALPFYHIPYFSYKLDWSFSMLFFLYLTSY